MYELETGHFLIKEMKLYRSQDHQKHCTTDECFSPCACMTTDNDSRIKHQLECLAGSRKLSPYLRVCMGARYNACCPV